MRPSELTGQVVSVDWAPVSTGYRIGEQIFQSHKAIIFRAQWEADTEHPLFPSGKFVFKWFPPSVDPREFNTEIEILSELQGFSAFVPMCDPTQFYRSAGFFMPMCKCDLLEYLMGGENVGPHVLDENAARQFSRDAAQAVARCHQLGIVHVDVKLDNFLLVRDGDDRLRVVLADFGLARRCDGEGIHEGEVGTPNYQAPELWIGSSELTPLPAIQSRWVPQHSGSEGFGKKPRPAPACKTTPFWKDWGRPTLPHQGGVGPIFWFGTAATAYNGRSRCGHPPADP